VQIRRATAEDAPALAARMKVVADENVGLGTQSNRTVEELTERFQNGIGEGAIMLALEDEGRIVGALGLHPERVSGVYDLGMWILAEYRGQGWGRKLVQAGLEAAREAGVRKLELEVFPDNGRAISLYAKCGFEVEGYRRNHYPRLDGSIKSSLIMAHFLGQG
jgi:ribosomal protein S18 acetylase RimI-like enzyme